MLFTWEINSKQIEQQQSLEMETRVTLCVGWQCKFNNKLWRNIRCCTWQNLSKYFDITMSELLLGALVHDGQGMCWPKIQNWDANECSCQSCLVVALALALAQLFMTTPCGWWHTMPFGTWSRGCRVNSNMNMAHTHTHTFEFYTLTHIETHILAKGKSNWSICTLKSINTP